MRALGDAPTYKQKRPINKCERLSEPDYDKRVRMMLIKESLCMRKNEVRVNNRIKRTFCLNAIYAFLCLSNTLGESGCAKRQIAKYSF